jgi:hypothetical protein
VQHNFTALLATNRITGHLQTSGGSSITNVEVYAYATIGGKSYYVEANTDASGNYVLNVANGSWSVGVCCGCDSWNLGYCCPNDQNVVIANNNGVANFTTTGQVVITTPTSLPAGYAGDFYTTNFSATVCSPGTSWSATNPPAGLGLAPDGTLAGTPESCGSNYFFVRVYDGSGVWRDKAFSLVVNPATSGGVEFYYASKVRNYRQTNSASPVLDNSQGPYNSYLGIFQTMPCLVSSAKTTLPNSVQKNFPSGSSGQELLVHETFASTAALDASYPAGNYVFEMHTVNDGNQFPVLNLPATNYPNAPRLTNYPAAQSVNPATGFTLAWDAFTGGTIDDRVRLILRDAAAVPVYQLLYPDAVVEEWLDGTVTAVDIPGGLLEPNHTYLGQLQFIRVVGINLIGYPGAYGESSYCTQTAFSLITGSDAPTIGQPVKSSPTQFRFTVSGATGQYTIQRSTNLSTTNWSAILVTNAPVSPFTVIDPWATNPRSFYRAVRP